MSSYIVVLYVFLFYRQALELLYLFSEVETFYPLSPFLVSGLENWILKSPHQSPQNVLEWAPRESKVIWKLRWRLMKKIRTNEAKFWNAKQKVNCVLCYWEIYRVLCHWFQIYSFENEDSFWLLLQHVIWEVSGKMHFLW